MESTPAQLPSGVPGFAGREAELARLDHMVDTGGGPVIVAVSGSAGVGKTTLAVHWARRVADRYPDGQLYVNLRGFSPTGPLRDSAGIPKSDPAGAAVAPDEAVRGFLDALGVPPHRVPPSAEAQASLYRTLLAGRRVLVLLDNARDADHVRPLLPASPASLVLVTSRNQMPSLVAAEGAHPLRLDVLASADARRMLGRRLGADAIEAEPEATDEIVAECARLPLALAVVAALAATRPRYSLRRLAEELRESRGRLDALDAGDPLTDVRAVFSWSYRALAPAARRLFRLLGLHPGPDIGADAAAGLAGAPIRLARPLLADLARAHLVTEHAPGRYAFHDLLRAYAAELAETVDAEDDRRDAVRRLLDHYLHTAHAAALALNPHREPIALDPPDPAVSTEDIANADEALAWFTDEHAVLVGAVGAAHAAGLDGHAWRLAWCLADYLERRGHWRDWVVAYSTAVAATERLGGRPERARAHYGLARAHGRLDEYERARAHYDRASALYAELGDAAGQANIHLNVAMLVHGRGRHAEALEHAEKALDLYRSLDNRAGQADALNAIGWYQGQLGDHERSLASCREALALVEEIGDRYGMANTWDSLGYAHHHLARYRDAIRCYGRAIELFQETGDRPYEADTLTHLGDSHDAAGEADAAREAWRRALEILTELDHPDADGVRRRLQSPGTSRTPVP